MARTATAVAAIAGTFSAVRRDEPWADVEAPGFCRLGYPLAGVLPALFAQPSLAADLCVGGDPGCYATLQAAVNAARNGDTIIIAPGTYAGGVTIGVTREDPRSGGKHDGDPRRGSVLTIGTYGASAEPTVSVSGVTVTGSVARSAPESVPFTGEVGVIARGRRGGAPAERRLRQIRTRQPAARSAEAPCRTWVGECRI